MYPFNLDRISLCFQSSVYSNPWASGSTQDEGRTEDMLYEETTLALDLHFLELEHRRSKAKEGWVPGYLEALRKLAEEEQKASNKLRRRSLDLGDPPAYVVRLHRHRRHLACIRQDIDLIEQAVTDASNGEDLADVCLYIKHAIQNGSAIITGASYVSIPLYLFICVAKICGLGSTGNTSSVNMASSYVVYACSSYSCFVLWYPLSVWPEFGVASFEAQLGNPRSNVGA